MRTTIDLPNDLLKNVQIFFRAKTKKGAIMKALENALENAAYQGLLDAGGKYPEIKKMINLDIVRDRNHYKKFKRWKKRSS